MTGWRTGAERPTEIYYGNQLYGSMNTPEQAEGVVQVLKRQQAMWDRVVEWRDKHDIGCAESIFQMDGPQIDATTLCGDVVEMVGYVEHPEDDDQW